MAAFQKGQRLTGLLRSYRLLEPAHARTNSVWRAHVENAQSSTDEIVIVKSAKPALLERERHHLSVLKGHPCIRQVMDNVDNPESMVLEYMETDLRTESCKRRLSTLEIKIIAKRFLEGLSWAHSENIVHTDLKPQNILLTGFSGPNFNPASASVKIADWANSSLPMSGLQITPPSFRSPESWLELPWGTPADIWSFGAIIGSLMMGPHRELFGSSAEDEADASIEMLQKQNAMTGEYPEAMIHRAGGAFPALFKHFNDIKAANKAAGQQYWEWRWIMRELGIKDEDGAFVEGVLKIDPDQRPSAATLLNDEWFEGS